MTADAKLEAQIISIGLKHHCLGCVADGVFCPTYDDLPAGRRGVRDTILPAVEELLALQDRLYNDRFEAALQAAQQRYGIEAVGMEAARQRWYEGGNNE